MPSKMSNVNDNVIVDGILVIPAKQQYGEFFSFVERTKDHTKVHRDVKKDISDNYLLTIKTLAKILGIKGISKLKKDDLIALVTHRVRFE